MTKTIEALLTETRIFNPSDKLVKESNVKIWMNRHGIKTYEELLEKAKNTEWFWDEIAKELEWFKPWNRVLEWIPPHARWFIRGEFNIAHNALDRHINTPRQNKTAYIWEGERGGVRKLTYHDLYQESNKLAAALKNLGIKKGDRVMIYLPMILELPIAMLACAKIGAVHCVVFSGFSPNALRERVNNAEAKIIITADGGYRRGKIIQTKKNTDEALRNTPTVKNVIVVRRTGEQIEMAPERDLWWDEIVKNTSAPSETQTTPLSSEDELFILYTSGTTGKPKGVVHVHGGYAVGIYNTLKWVFDVKEKDVWWCTADIGWVTGHSYAVYAPLMLGTTSIMYEGAPDYPSPDRWWSIIEKHKATILYTAPTSIRMFMKYGEEWTKKHNLSSLRLLGSVGEPINPEAWMWYYKNIGNEQCQIMDTWWQTETGNFMISPLPITPLKPGSAAKPLPGIEADVVDEDGRPVVGKGGYLVIKKPWPAMLRTLYKDLGRYEQQYWSKFLDSYLAGDIARKDEDGYFWFQGRADDVLNIAGHRIGTAEVESALVSHPAVAEAAAIGVPDVIKGEIIKAFIILKKETEPSAELEKELKSWVGKEISPIAKPELIEFVESLPKTRSGKIMRRVLKAKELGESLGDTSTLEE
ncbi:MAG: acetate--CoA ligase [Actinobacteria bacterium]|nr:acetate--CoA ligase [Actinomycetota bacterium]